MPEILDKNSMLWNAMNESLTNFFMDNSVPPEVTIARLKELSGECSRLAQFMIDENPSLIRVAEQRDGAVQPIREACDYDTHVYYILFLNYKYCPYCARALHS